MSSDVWSVVGLAVDAVLMTSVYYAIKQIKKSSVEIEKAPHYTLGDELVKAVKDSDAGCLAYASVEGEVMPVGQVLKSHHTEDKLGVMRSADIVEHKSKRVNGVWLESKNHIQDQLDTVPFIMRRWMGKGGDTELHVQDASEASFLLNDLTTTYDNFKPNQAGGLSQGFDRLAGEVTKGVHTTEKMLLTNTILLGIGEIALVDGKLQLQQPSSGLDYILTTRSKAEILRAFKNRLFWLKVAAGITGAIGGGIIVYLVWKYVKIWRQNQNRELLEEEMREIRLRNVAQNRGDHSDDSQDADRSCVVCLTNPREIVLLNCGHLCLCADCLVAYPKPLTCPVCRAAVQSYTAVYNP